MQLIHMGFTDIFRKWRPKGKMYSLRCNQCEKGFLSSFALEAPVCGSCMQKIKSSDSTIDYDKKCATCGNMGIIHAKTQCYSCYFRLQK